MTKKYSFIHSELIYLEFLHGSLGLRSVIVTAVTLVPDQELPHAEGTAKKKGRKERKEESHLFSFYNVPEHCTKKSWGLNCKTR